jgi:hypothetical protein
MKALEYPSSGFDPGGTLFCDDLVSSVFGIYVQAEMHFYSHPLAICVLMYKLSITFPLVGSDGILKINTNL